MDPNSHLLLRSNPNASFRSEHASPRESLTMMKKSDDIFMMDEDLKQKSQALLSILSQPKLQSQEMIIAGQDPVLNEMGNNLKSLLNIPK
jgi:hypothetical protein